MSSWKLTSELRHRLVSQKEARNYAKSPALPFTLTTNVSVLGWNTRHDAPPVDAAVSLVSLPPEIKVGTR